MASPMILSTRPPKAVTSRTSRSKARSTRRLTCSGSWVSDQVVKPTRSANSTVTTRRSSDRRLRTAWPHDAAEPRASAGARYRSSDRSSGSIRAELDGPGDVEAGFAGRLSSSHDEAQRQRACTGASTPERPAGGRRGAGSADRRLIGAVVDLIAAKGHLPGLGNDATSYVAIADNPGPPRPLGYFLEPRLTLWPPGWPATLAVFEWAFGIRPQ